MCLQTQENTLQSIQKTNKSLKLSSKEHSSDSAALREVLQERDVEIQQWKYRAEKLQDSLSHTQAQLKQSKAEKRELRMDLAAAADRTVQYNELMERSRGRSCNSAWTISVVTPTPTPGWTVTLTLMAAVHHPHHTEGMTSQRRVGCDTQSLTVHTEALM